MAEGFILADEPRLFDRLEAQPSDSLLALIGLAKADTRPEKIDVGVGVYRDAAGGTPILRCVKAAEKILLETQETKAYLGSEGDARFTELIKPIVFGGGYTKQGLIAALERANGRGSSASGQSVAEAAAVAPPVN